MTVAVVAVCDIAGCGGDERPPVTAPSPTAGIDSLPVATPVPPSPVAPPPVQPTAVPSPRPPATPRSGPATVVSRGPATRRAVALTFDAGADRGFAETILNILAREGVAGSFGMTGQWAEKNADLVARMANEGHLLITHTYDHASFTGLSTTGRAMPRAQRWSELDRTEQIVSAITGRSTRPFFRPPYGDYDASVNNDVGDRGYAYNVMWTVDSRGWMGLAAPEITRRCLDLAEPGAIYVFHVGAASADAQALPSIIAELRIRGYAFVRVSDLVE
jgi:peptidoglycan/xylan/chitin deacetylase (PgdA/CDA1 family)